MSVISGIATALPPYKHKQADLATFMCDLFQCPDDEKRRLNTLFARSGIETRYSVIPDYSLTREERVFFPKTSNLEPFPSLEYRMKYFHPEALSLCVAAIQSCIQDKVEASQVTHLITVSCTGLSAPGLDIDIVQQLNLRGDINRTSVNFMGCYAAIHGLKQADYICRCEPDAVVVVVCIELCTIHFQKTNDIDNITANLLFADGAAAALVVADGVAAQNNFRGYGIRKFSSQVQLSGKRDMAWQLSSSGFVMTLSAYIPQLIEQGVKSLFEKGIKQMGLQKSDITHWAIHPGGRKILEVIQQELELQDEDMESAYRVLKNYGNMSSPTILFVLKDIWDNKVNSNLKELTYGAAFGPGLTMETVILENV